MDLKDFIKESLVQISTGIQEANEELEGTGATVNPAGGSVINNNYQLYGQVNENPNNESKKGNIHMVSFDVALRAESGSQKGGGLKVAALAVGLGAEGKSSEANTSESRVQFSIPMVFPQKKYKHIVK